MAEVILGQALAKFGWIMLEYTSKKIVAYLRKAFNRDEAIVVLQIGRPDVAEAVASQFGKEKIAAVVHREGVVKVKEFRKVAHECYSCISALHTLMGREKKFKKVKLVLSGPVIINFQVGQLVGLQKTVELWYWNREKDKYVKVSNIDLGMRTTLASPRIK